MVNSSAYSTNTAANPIPAGNYTPWGYIQNPYHRVRHRSGIWRMHDRLSGLTMQVCMRAYLNISLLQLKVFTLRVNTSEPAPFVPLCLC